MSLRSDPALVVVLLVSLIAPGAWGQTVIPVGGRVENLAVNPVTNQVWATARLDAVVVVLDGADHSVQTISVGPSPGQILVDPVRNRAFVLHAGETFVSIIDGTTLAVDTVAVGTGPAQMAFDPARNRLYVANRTSDTVSVIDPSTLAVSAVAVPGWPQNVAVDPSTGRVFVATFFDSVDFQDSFGRVFALGGDPIDVLQSVAVFNDSLGMRGVGADPASGNAWVLDGDIRVHRIVWAGPSQLSRIVGLFPSSLIFLPSRDRVWTTAFEQDCDGSVRAFDATSATQLFSGFVCAGAVASNPATERIYAAEYIESFPDDVYQLRVVDMDALTTSTLALTEFAAVTAVNVATNRIYATSFTRLLEIDEPVAAPVPLDTAISVDWVSPLGDASISFEATSGFAPFALPIRQIYYQVDATDGEWLPAEAAGANASAQLGGLAPGVHVVHAFATDGQEATLSAAHGRSPVVGPIASLEIKVPGPPACSDGIDNDGDGLVDWPEDPGCANAYGAREDPECSDGVDNDGDGFVDWPDDPQCVGPWDNSEANKPPLVCGLGAELVLLLPALAWASRRRGRKRVRT